MDAPTRIRYRQHPPRGALEAFLGGATSVETRCLTPDKIVRGSAKKGAEGASMRILALFIAIFIAGTSSSLAQSDSLAAQSKLAASAQYIVARSQLSSAGTLKLAYVGLRIEDALNAATSSHLNTADTDKIVQAAIQDAHQYVNELWFSDSLSESTLSSAKMTYAVSLKTHQLSIEQKDFNSAIQRGRRALAQPDGFPTKLSTDDLLQITLWIYSEASDKRSALRRYFVPEINRYQNLQPEQDPIFDPDARVDAKYRALSTYLSKIDPNVALMAKNFKVPGSLDSAMITETAALSGAVNVVITAMSSPDKVSKNKDVENKQSNTEPGKQPSAGTPSPGKSKQDKETDIEKSNYTGAFGAASAIATLSGAPDTAEKFEKLEKLSSAIYDIAKSDVLFDQAPFAVINPYLATAVIAADLLSSSKDNPNAAIMEQLREIQKQLLELRTLIVDRFDRIEFKLDSHFAEIESLLDTIRSDQQVTNDELDALQEHINALQLADQKAFLALGQVIMEDLREKCFPITKKPLTHDIFIYCWNTYLDLADGQFESLLKLHQPEESSNAIAALSQDTAILEGLAERFNELYPAEQVTTPLLDPVQFRWGVFFLKALKDRNPHQSPVDNQSDVPIPGNEIDTHQVRNSAVEAERFLQIIAVKPERKLRVELFDRIFADYESAIEHVWGNTERIFDNDRINMRGQALKALNWPTGPNILNFDDRAPIITREQFNEKLFQVALRAEGPKDPPVSIPLCAGSAIVLKVDSHEQPLQINILFRFDPEIFNELPGVVRWTLLDNLFGAQATYCMSKVSISNLILGEGDVNPGHPGGRRFGPQWHPAAANADFEIRISFKYEDADGEHDITLPDLTTHYEYTRANEADKYACGWRNHYNQNTVRFVEALWNGGGLYGCNETWLPVDGAAQNNGRLKLSLGPLSQQQKVQLQELSTRYASLAKPVLENVKKKALGDSTTSVEDADRATKELIYLVRNGIGGEDFDLRSLYYWLLDPTKMPNGTSWITAFLEEGLSEGAFQAAIHKRNTEFDGLLEKVGSNPNLMPGYDRLRSPIEFLQANR